MQRSYGQEPQIVLMTPIIEGLDGVQKMSKSYGNAIGIHEPPQEMYGKLMSINDELMWRYWTLLTDLRQSEIDQMRADVASGVLHPMEAKKRLARTIVGGFHSGEVTRQADESWARMFQQKDIALNIEELAPSTLAEFSDLHTQLHPTDFAGEGPFTLIKIPPLLTKMELTTSNSEAQRKLKERAVTINGEVWTKPVYPVENRHFSSDHRGFRLVVRVGKRAKAITLLQ